MAMGNVVALILFSSRNSILLYITDWSYGTYLLLHRWLGYWAVLHTVIHSAMLWRYYVQAGTNSAEILRVYWQWGIVGTVAACAIIPFSLLWTRQKFYEFFIISHIVLSLLFLVGYYYHIWYVYSYNWGYEIWMFVAVGIWGLERLVRVGRMGLHGSCTAVVAVIPEADGEYMQISIEGKHLEAGVAYLCFPTLSWRFWETHPFSVSGCSVGSDQGLVLPSQSTAASDTSPEIGSAHEKGAAIAAASRVSDDEDSQTRNASTMFFARTRTGITKTLAQKALATSTNCVRLRVLIDGPYDHSGRVCSQVAQCSSILCIAGGVGITACLSLLLQSEPKELKLFWSSRNAGLVAALTPTLTALSSSVEVNTIVRERFDLGLIVREALIRNEGGSEAPLAIVVSGPPGLADDVRLRVTNIARNGKQIRAFVLIDEAFGW
jgi:hypothetical protein